MLRRRSWSRSESLLPSYLTSSLTGRKFVPSEANVQRSGLRAALYINTARMRPRSLQRELHSPMDPGRKTDGDSIASDGSEVAIMAKKTVHLQ